MIERDDDSSHPLTPPPDHPLIPARPRPRITRRLARWRAWVQAALALVWLGPFGLRMHGVCSPVFHCYSCPLASFACPIGVLAQFAACHTIPFLAIGTLLAVGSVFGSFVCGWACPFGFLQDLAARLPVPKFHLPSWLGYSRYAVLVGFVLLVPYCLGEGHPLFFCRLCPAAVLEGTVPDAVGHVWSGTGDSIAWPSVAAMAISSILVIAIFFTWRPWCTLFCPLGAIFSLCNRVSMVFVRFRAERCNDCDLCRDLCKYRGPGEQRAGDLRCIRCLDCVRCKALGVGTVFQPPEGPSP